MRTDRRQPCNDNPMSRDILQVLEIWTDTQFSRGGGQWGGKRGNLGKLEGLIRDYRPRYRFLQPPAAWCWRADLHSDVLVLNRRDATLKRKPPVRDWHLDELPLAASSDLPTRKFSWGTCTEARTRRNQSRSSMHLKSPQQQILVVSSFF